MTSGEVQDGARLSLLPVRGTGQAGAGSSRCVRGRLGAAEHWPPPHLCSLSSAGDGSAAYACLTSLGRPCAAPRRRGHVWTRQQTRSRRRGLRAPREEAEPRGEDHDHAYRAHSSWGHLFHGSWAPPAPVLTTCQTPISVLRPNRPEPLLPVPPSLAGSTLQNTLLKETEDMTSAFFLQIGKQVPRGHVTCQKT